MAINLARLPSRLYPVLCPHCLCAISKPFPIVGVLWGCREMATDKSSGWFFREDVWKRHPVGKQSFTRNFILACKMGLVEEVFPNQRRGIWRVTANGRRLINEWLKCGYTPDWSKRRRSTAQIRKLLSQRPLPPMPKPAATPSKPSVGYVPKIKSLRGPGRPRKVVLEAGGIGPEEARA